MFVIGVGIFAAAIMLLISAIHTFWALGGTWGLKATIPDIEGKPLYAATPLSTFTIAFILFIGALIVLGRLGFFGRPQLEILYFWGPWLLAAIFLIRAIGDFHYIGLFKKVRNSQFAFLDTRLFAPISLLLGLACAIVAISPIPWPL